VLTQNPDHRKPEGQAMLNRRTLIAAAGALALSATAASANWQSQYPELVFAVVPAENAQGVTDRYQPFADYLSKELGTKVTLRVANDYAAVIEGQRTGNIHIGYYGPAAYARALVSGAPVQAVMQDVNADGTRGYYSVAYVKADNPATKIEDLKGKVLGLVDPNSASGNNVPRFAMNKLGIDPEQFFSKVVYTGSHENAITALQQGTVDVAFNWWNDEAESNLMRMERKGMAKYSDFKIVFRSDLITGSPWAILSNMPDDAKTAIANAMLAVPTKAPEVFQKMTDGKAQPWVPVTNAEYNTMVELILFVDELKKKQAGG
jgi:phosphonate transport system substrate-binding protein